MEKVESFGLLVNYLLDYLEGIGWEGMGREGNLRLSSLISFGATIIFYGISSLILIYDGLCFGCSLPVAVLEERRSLAILSLRFVPILALDFLCSPLLNG